MHALDLTDCISFICVSIRQLTALLAFVLPPESGEKVSLGVTVLLALTVFLLLVADTLPPLSDSIPLMGKFHYISFHNNGNIKS